MSCNRKTLDIVSVPKGNDIKITWSIYNNPIDLRPYNLEGKVVDVYLKSRYRVEKAQDLSVSGNTITCFFYGKDQKYLGPYSIELVENDGLKGMRTIDGFTAFELVKCMSEADSNDGEEIVYTTSLEFRTAKQIDVIAGFSIDDDMILNLSYTSAEDMNNTFTIDNEGQLTLNQAYDKDN